MEPMRLKIRKTASGTYYIPSLNQTIKNSIKDT